MAILFTLRVFARNLLRGNRRRNTFCILFCCLVWGSNPGFTSNKPTHYLLDYGDPSRSYLSFHNNGPVTNPWQISVNYFIYLHTFKNYCRGFYLLSINQGFLGNWLTLADPKIIDIHLSLPKNNT